MAIADPVPNNNPLTERLPPQNLEAERSLIGGFILQNTSVDDVQAIVQPNHFYASPHRLMAETIYAMRANMKPIDGVTLGRELERRDWLAEVGGALYLIQCMETVPHAGHCEYYARIVREMWVRRTIIEACMDTLRDAWENGKDTDDVLARHDTNTQKLLEAGSHSESTLSISDLLVKALEQADNKDDAARVGINTGYGCLDHVLGGIFGGNFFVLAARASVGKTALALNLALSFSRGNLPVLFFSLEQGALEICERLLSIESGISAYNLRKGDLTDEQHAQLVAAQNTLNNLPLHIDESCELTVPQIGAKARLWKRRHKIRVVFIDYLQLIESEDHRVNREQQVARIGRGLKKLARALDIPVICLAQLNRDLEKRDDKHPRLSDLRESGSLEQDADQVVFLHRPDFWDPDDRPGVVELLVAKNRNGPRAVGKEALVIYWDAKTMRFYEAIADEDGRRIEKQLTLDGDDRDF